MRYPELPMYKQMTTAELTDLYDTIKQWSALMLQELDTRDAEVRDTPAYQVVAITTTSDFTGVPIGGNIVYSASTGIYYGWDAITEQWDAMT